MANTEIGLRAHAALKGFVTKNAANFVVGECKSWDKNIPCYGKIELNSSGAMCEVAMVKQGVEVKVAQERLGHKDITTTMNIYAHVLPGSAKEAAEKIGQLVYKDQAV